MMRRFVIDGLSAALVALSLGVGGCGGSGISEGMPQDTTPPPPPEGVQLKMGNIKPTPPGKVAGTGTLTTTQR
jgi:hypothetical protein